MVTTKTVKSNNKNQALALDKTEQWVNRLKWILFAVAFLVYSNSLTNGYNMDDYLVTKDHKFTSQGLSSVKDIFTSPYYSDDQGYSYGYRPIVHLSYAIEHDIFGQNPQAGHFVNLLLFGLSVFFLFKLLIHLFGKESYKYAFVASLLFAIHPIHTEVVNSLKNRDEILSFLFVIISGLQLFKYLDKKKLPHFGLSFLFFVIAILSKKSIYPMIIILPAAYYLIKNVSFKHLLIITTTLSIPAAIFASEMQKGRMILLVVFPIFCLLVVYVIKHAKEIYEEHKTLPLKLTWLLPAFIALGISYYSIIHNEIIYLIGVIPFFFLTLTLNHKAGLWFISVASLIVAIKFDYNEFTITQLVLVSGVASYQLFIQKKKDIPYLIYSAINISILFYITQTPSVFLFALNLLVFFWLHTSKGIKTSFIYALFTLAIILSVLLIREKEIFFTSSGAIYSYLLILTFISLTLKKLQEEKKWFSYQPVFILLIGFSITSFIVFQERKEFEQTASIESTTSSDTENFVRKPTKTILNESKNIFQEGRSLEYVENPLVIPHSNSEKIATGFYTLGHYARLMIFPKTLSYYYGFAEIEMQNLKSSWVWVSILFHLGLVSLILIYFRRNWYITIGFAWYITCILLFSNWVELVAGVVGERLAYLASAGFLIGIAGIIQEIRLLEKKKEVYLIPLSIIFLLLIGRTWVRNADWESDYKLMKHDIKHLDKSAQAHNLYASVLMRQGAETPGLTAEQQLTFYKAGNKHFERATEIDTLFFNAFYDLGRSSMYVLDTAKAMKAFERCVQINPDFEDPKLKVSYLKLFYSQYQGEDKMEYQVYWDSLQRANTPNP